MTRQVKGLCWSMGIHGTFFLIFILLQFFVVVQDKVTVIDFTFSGNNNSSVKEQFSLPQPAAKHGLQHDAALKRTTVERRSNKAREAEMAALPEQLNSNDELPSQENPASAVADETFSPVSTSGGNNHQTLDDPRITSGMGSIQNGANRSGTAQVREERSVGSGAPSGTPEQAREIYIKEHFAYIRNKIMSNILYPQLARKMGWCGQVKIAFIVCEDGKVNDVRVVDTSGFQVLDQNAVDTVKNIAPFPRPPVKAEIRMAVTYRLN